MSDDTHADLWWHLMERHGLDVGQVHGDPELMHAAVHIPGFGIADHEHAPEPTP